MGMVYLTSLDRETRSSEWGFYIGEEAYRGKGYGKAILLKLLKRFFDEMKFETLITKVLPSNETARGLYQKFGFQETASNNNMITLRFTKTNWDERKSQLHEYAH
jgi:UDP-4-amino-4,6-dideoxy-N-acetyl-beta-L-altrosamine N-acetyltransferase